MPWVPPTFTPGVTWQDSPSTASPLNATDLNLDEGTLATFAVAVGTSLNNYMPQVGASVAPRNVTGSTALAVDPRGKGFLDTLTGATTYTTPTGAASGTVCRIDLQIKQDGTGGRTVTWWGGIVWMNGVAPTIPTAINTSMLINFISLDGGTTWIGSYYVASVVGSDGKIGGPGTVGLTTIPGLTTMVWFGSTAGTARPTGFDFVIWVGSVQPTNMSATADIWINTA